MTGSASALETLTHIPLAPFGRVVEAPEGATIDDLPVAALARWTEESRVLVLRGFTPMEKERFADYCRQWGEVLRWDAGEVIDLVVQDDPKNYVFSSGDVPFHWDGAFVEANPRFFVFQCLDAAPDAGGETVFCDTTAVYRDAEPELRELWSRVTMTYTTEKLAHYGGRVTEKLLSQHPGTGLPVLRYAEPLDPAVYKNPVYVAVDGVEAERADDFLAALSERLHRPEYCYAHAWQAGDLVIADNYALLHGRNAFTGPTTRHLQRVQII
ncbi:TauD/TfdA dioxygenase family protein [Allostreptomyces psammosilenae]|uniref:Alpha-ketoglutarate-dependent taurine dioxygenase n=1 Tax=Allostreptomyces psammosilenae TaxID=1892865 RepID=A0A852ZY33_9ACTN|nr:TauD/TfdA family dioxygenase [Allostreptomyces psammosilenae]NYI06965.1 alpha-ketoglutarate-dependent taurine dioxygenase [Allostreptomyces psammosilenae]